MLRFSKSILQKVETKAISIPEKNADNSIQMKIITLSLIAVVKHNGSANFFYDVFGKILI